MAANPLVDCTGFLWNEWNTGKNWERHRVTPEEAEELFFNEPFVVRFDAGHSYKEKRYQAVGRTARGRKLFVAFTIKENLIRVISVRDVNLREGRTYDRSEKADSRI